MKLRMRNRMSDKVLPVPVLLAALVTAGCETAMMAPARQDTTPDPVRETVAVQELRQEVAELRDNVEVQRNELQKLRERQRQLYDDLDHRLRQSEQASGGAPGQRQNSRGGQESAAAGQGRQGGEQAQQVYGQQATVQIDREADGEDDQGASEEGAEAGSQQAGDSEQGTQTAARRQVQQPSTPESGSAGVQQAAVASSAEQAAYDDAFELLKQSRYNDAIIDFQSMIEAFPNGALVDDAQYWIGEAYYVTRDFESARSAFRTVVNQYPDSSRVPEAMLKLGYVQAELGEMEQARQTLNQVISEYPGSRVAISAETRLNKIR